MHSFALSVAALIPALLLCWYIYAKDRVEKEPFVLLAGLFVAGAAVYLPTIFCENELIKLLDSAFSPHMNFSLTGIASFTSEGARAAHCAIRGFAAVALLEETAKWLLLFFITRNSKHFSHLFDGIVYAVFVSLGFAALENVRFAVMDGWDMFLMRSLTSVPGHMTFGVIMGFCYTVWHTWKLAAKEEKALAASGRITVSKPIRSAPWLIASLILPILTHGCYSFIRFYTSEVMSILFYIFIFLLYVACFIAIRRLSAADGEDDQLAHRLLLRKYPALRQTDHVAAAD